jgi:DNA-binding transcriptional MerR regulator
VAPTTEERTWTVRELADELGVSTRTLRFYEDQGLIAPQRLGTARIYHPRERTRLALILRGKRFGMTLSEISDIVGMYDGAASGERRQLQTLLGRLDELSLDLKARQADLKRTLHEIEIVSEQCRNRVEELQP